MSNLQFYPVYDDLLAPVTGINPIGAPSDPTVITSLADFTGGLSFSGTVENIIAQIYQIPHHAERGAIITPHIHWLKPTGSANAVTWEYWYRLIGNPGTTSGAWVGPVIGSIVVGDQTVSNQHLITSFGTLTLTGSKESYILATRVHRRGDTDADNNAVTLLSYDTHYRRVSHGSRTEFAS